MLKRVQFCTLIYLFGRRSVSCKILQKKWTWKNLEENIARRRIVFQGSGRISEHKLFYNGGQGRHSTVSGHGTRKARSLQMTYFVHSNKSSFAKQCSALIEAFIRVTFLKAYITITYHSSYFYVHLIFSYYTIALHR